MRRKACPHGPRMPRLSRPSLQKLVSLCRMGRAFLHVLPKRSLYLKLCSGSGKRYHPVICESKAMSLRSQSSISPLAYKQYPADLGHGSASGLATPSSASRHQSSEWSNHDIPEFVPQNFHHAQMVSNALLICESWSAWICVPGSPRPVATYSMPIAYLSSLSRQCVGSKLMALMLQLCSTVAPMHCLLLMY